MGTAAFILSSRLMMKSHIKVRLGCRKRNVRTAHFFGETAPLYIHVFRPTVSYILLVLKGIIECIEFLLRISFRQPSDPEVA